MTSTYTHFSAPAAERPRAARRRRAAAMAAVTGLLVTTIVAPTSTAQPAGPAGPATTEAVAPASGPAGGATTADTGGALPTTVPTPDAGSAPTIVAEPVAQPAPAPERFVPVQQQYLTPAVPLVPSTTGYPVSYDDALAGVPLVRTADPQPVAGDYSMIVDLFGENAAQDGGRVDALDWTFTQYTTEKIKATGDCALVRIAADGTATTGAGLGTVSCTFDRDGHLVARVSRTTPDAKLLVGSSTKPITAPLRVNAEPSLVEMTRGVASGPSGPVHYAQPATFGLFDPGIIAVIPPASVPVHYPFAQDAQQALAGGIKLDFHGRRPYPVSGTFSQLIRLGGMEVRTEANTVVTPLDYTYAVTLPDGIRYSGGCSLVRFYSATNDLLPRTDGTISCAQAGQVLTITVSTNSTANDVLVGLTADTVTAPRTIGPRPFTLDVTRADRFPNPGGPDASAGLDRISGMVDLGIVVIPAGVEWPLATTTVAAPTPTAVPTTWVTPPSPAPKPPVWEKGPWGSLDGVMGSVSDGIMEVDLGVLPVPDVELPNLP